MMTHEYTYEYTAEVEFESRYSPVSKIDIGTDHAP